MENYFIAFYTLLGCLLTIGKAFTVRQDSNQVYLVFIFAIFTAFLAQVFLWKSGLILSYPELAYLNYPFSLLLGPLIERYFLVVAFRQTYSQRRFLSLLFAILTLGFIALELVIGDRQKIDVVKKVLSEGYAPAGRLMVLLTFLVFTIFLIRLFYKFFAHFRLKSLFQSQPIRYLILIALAQFVSIIIGVFYVYFIFEGKVDARSVIVHNIGALFCVVVILEQAYPEIIEDLQKDVEKEQKYKNSQLGSVDIDAITTQLHELLFNQKIYRDEHLSQDQLASKLNLNRHQFSEYLSQHQQVSFFQLVNKYRIKESKELLLNQQSETILSIAFAVGFQTKSVFNSAFKKETGMTPSDYRKKQLEKTDRSP